MDFLFHWYTANVPEVHTTAICLATTIWMLLPRAQDRRTEIALENTGEDNSVPIPAFPPEERSTSSSSLRRRSQYKIESPKFPNAVSSSFSARY
ncbi:hypothetical protein N7481_001146 [Penicillium waksmanii]|uniref:uncharacterized protein n=1 Tax=Penicillium waksmanii TaxID=69791 RepID=UPI0025473367|nr:uncharacterized protein N7481_001146 [Penicillium waksmanii]KAJ6000737.1 hypothetical protein N7481_001146 [Penicillium waksmanii]